MRGAAHTALCRAVLNNLHAVPLRLFPLTSFGHISQKFLPRRAQRLIVIPAGAALRAGQEAHIRQSVARRSTLQVENLYGNRFAFDIH